MADVTQNFLIAPQDGWIEIAPAASSIALLDIKAYPCRAGFYVFIGESAPDSADKTPIGRVINGECLFINVPFTGGVWARTFDSMAGSSDDIQHIRLDVTIIPTADSPAASVSIQTPLDVNVTNTSLDVHVNNTTADPVHTLEVTP